MKCKKLFRLLFLLTPIISLTTAFSYAQDKCNAVYGTGPVNISLSTGSSYELGLLEIISEKFCKGKKCPFAGSKQVQVLH